MSAPICDRFGKPLGTFGPSVSIAASEACETRYVHAFAASAGSGPTSANRAPPIGGTIVCETCSVASNADIAWVARCLPIR